MKIKIGFSAILCAFLLTSVVLGETEKEYYPNGQLKSEVNIDKDSKQNRISKEYYESGKLKVELNWKDGEFDGIAKGYYENGNPKMESNWKDGKRDGTREF